MSIPYTRNERLITVKGLGVSYSGRPVIRDVSFEVDNLSRPSVAQGQVVAILGPSGCGKTTLLRCLSGLQKEGDIVGTIELPGGKAPHPGDVGVVFQSYPLLQHRTIYSNIEVAAKSPELLSSALALVEHFGLRDKLRSYPKELSGGQRQRLAIIQQLAACDHLLVLDEPTSGLDPKSKRSVLEALKELSLKHEHNTIFMVSHDVRSALQVADTVWILGREGDKPGYTIVKTYDLIALDIAWRELDDADTERRIDALAREIEHSLRSQT